MTLVLGGSDGWFRVLRTRLWYYHGPGVAKFENGCSKRQSLKCWTQAVTIRLSEDVLLPFLPQSREQLAGSLFRAESRVLQL